MHVTNEIESIFHSKCDAFSNGSVHSECHFFDFSDCFQTYDGDYRINARRQESTSKFLGDHLSALHQLCAQSSY